MEKEIAFALAQLRHLYPQLKELNPGLADGILARSIRTLEKYHTPRDRGSTMHTLEALIAETIELLNILEAKKQLDAGFKGMGVNILIEKAYRLPSQIRRVRRQIDELSTIPAQHAPEAQGCMPDPQCGCCECRGIHCMMPHPGHSHRNPGYDQARTKVY